MITRVTVEGFRGISGTEVFEPKNLTVLTGRNGFGKTTFFDAIDWCLFGEASRLGSQRGLIKNLYRHESHPSVEVILNLGVNAAAILRTEDGLSLDGMPVSERELAEALIIDTDVFPPYMRELGRQVRTVTYLPQEQIREFVNASLTSERKALLQGLLGVPNAGVVESSIKRVRDHFSVREKTLIEEIVTLQQELDQMAIGVQFDPTVERDAEDFLAQFRTRYRDNLARIDNLRLAMEGDLAAHQSIAVLVDSLLAAHSGTASTLTQSDKEIADLQHQHAELLKQAAETDSRSAEITALIDAALIVQQDASRELLAEEGRVAHLTSTLSKKQRSAELSEELANWDNEREETTARSAELRKSNERFQVELETAEQLADTYRIQTKLGQERVEIELRATELENRLLKLRDERQLRRSEFATAQNAEANTANDMTKALALRDTASVAHDLALRSAQRAAQVTDLRSKLISLIEVGDSECPLCGAEYGTHDGLLEHLAQDTSGSQVDDELRKASNTLSESETKLQEITARKRLEAVATDEQRNAVEELDRDIAQLETRRASLTLSLQGIARSVEPKLSTDVLAKVDELRTKVEVADRLLSQREDEIRSIEKQRGRIAIELENLKGNGPSPLLSDVTTELVSDAHKLLSDKRNRLGASEQDLRKLRDRQATLESHSADTRSRIASTIGRLGAEHDRQRRVLETFERQCKSVGLVDVNLQTVGNELQRRAEEVETEIGELRNAISRAKAIERRQVVNEGVTKQRDLQERLAEAQERSSMLRRAQNRFHIIAEELVGRSKSEAESAGAQHLAAIQECVNDLYPHRHLNEVEIDFAEGELLVKDRWLKRGVRPQDYSSTGQANVLALSVFLGLALRQTFSLTRFLLLDEPVQNLDDLHFLAFLTLLKRVAMSRQVIISTADSNVAEILRRQLRSWSITDRTWCEYEWVAFQPETGPTIKRREAKKVAAA